MKKSRFLHVAIIVATLALLPPAHADLCNVKVVTDANPDYTDMGSLIYSATSNWQETSNKVWAIWYWNIFAKRVAYQMKLYGRELTEPIQQFNDYGYALCSTASGINCTIFAAMGLPVKFWDVSNHTVMEVEYDGKYHMIDNDFTGLYTLCDGHTLASLDEIGQEGACAASGGKVERGHIAKYHCLTGTSPNGFLNNSEGRPLSYLADCFNPRYLKFRHYLCDWDFSHRYILNLRDNEVYTRSYHRLDADGPLAVPQPKEGKNWRADPAYYVPNYYLEGTNLEGFDPEMLTQESHLRGNGVRTYAPDLSTGGFPKSAWTIEGVTATATGVIPTVAGKAGSVIFRVEGANVITSLKIKAEVARKSPADRAAIAISTDNGVNWKEVYTGNQIGKQPVEQKLIAEVNGSYAVLVKVSLLGQASAADAALQSIRFDTITQLNSMAQPQLKIGKNTVYVGAGEQSGSIVLVPDFSTTNSKASALIEQNILRTNDSSRIRTDPSLHCASTKEECYVVYKIDAPTDVTKITYGARMWRRSGHIDFRHSFDGGKTWIQSYSWTDNNLPWEMVHYESVTNIPAGTRSVQFKYAMTSSAEFYTFALNKVRMEVNHKLITSNSGPVEVTFNWSERQKDYKLVPRSHTQLVGKLPSTYTINVGGVDHPIVDSLTVNLKGARGDLKYGYSDGKDVGGEKWVGQWATYGKNFALGKPYTVSVPSSTGWGAGDPEGKKLTDGVVGPNHSGGSDFANGLLWGEGTKPEIVVDLGEAQKCAAFRIHIEGYPQPDALKGEIKDQAEVLTSLDGKEFKSVGFFDFNLRWKNLPVNDFWVFPDKLTGYNFLLAAPAPVTARYVKYKLTPARAFGVTEVQVLDSYKFEPFDLKLALPDGKDRSDFAAYPLRRETRTIYRRVLKMMGPDGGKLVSELPKD